VALQQIVEETVTGLGYDLVEIERSAGGLLRITIDWPWQGAASEETFVTVEDCEKVNRQLQFSLEVDGVDYKRLEVSSPGIDRPLRHEKDFERFTGELIDITLKAPMGDSAAGLVSANRKNSGARSNAMPPTQAGKSSGAMRPKPNLVNASAKSASPRRCRHWASRSMSCVRRVWLLWWISRGASPKLKPDRVVRIRIQSKSGQLLAQWNRRVES